MKLQLSEDVNFKTIAEIQGNVIDGNFSNDSSSEIRRVMDCTIYVSDSSFSINKDGKFWFDKFVTSYIGMHSIRNDEIKWYKLGVFVIKSGSYSYNETTNTLSLSLVDLVSTLNGDLGGVIKGAQKIEINAPITPSISSINQSSVVTYKKNIDGTNSSTQITYYFTVINITSENLIQDSDLICVKLPSDYISHSTQTIKRIMAINIDGTPIPILRNENSAEEYSTNAIYDTEFYAGTTYCFKYKSEYFVYMKTTAQISGAIESIITEYGNVKNYQIGEIGMEQPVTSDSPMPWLVPYDLSFDTGSFVYDVVIKLRDIYSGWQTYFDTDGKFICEMIPTCESDDILIDETVLDGLVTEESIPYDFTEVHNIVEIFGKCLETDHYCSTPTTKISLTDNRLYITLNIDFYATDESGNKNDPYVYLDDELIGFTMPYLSTEQRQYLKSNNSDIYIRINDLGYQLLIKDYESREHVRINSLLDNTGYCFKSKYQTASSCSFIFYGQFQVHAMAMLVDEEPSQSEKDLNVISNNCNTISYVYDNEYQSQFSIKNAKKELRTKLFGDDYELIYTDDLCRQRAEYELWKSARFTDTVTLTTTIIPFLDVNKKIKYKSVRTGITDTYLINKVSFSFSEFKMTLELRKFYPNYPYVINYQ